MHKEFSHLLIKKFNIDKLSTKNLYLFSDKTDTLPNDLYKKYSKNKRIVRKYYPNIKFAECIEELLNALSNKYSYALFEDIDCGNVDFYSSLWLKIFN